MALSGIAPCVVIAAVLAASGSAASALAQTPVGAVGVDVEALKLGQLPSAGSVAEADSCAAEGQHALIFMLQSGKAKGAADLAVPMLAWQKRAAALHAVELRAYTQDTAVVAAVRSLDAIDDATHLTLQAACAERLKTGPGA